MNEKELFYLLVLQKTKNIGTITAKKLIAYSGGIESVFLQSKKQLHRINGIGSFATEFLNDKNTFQKAEAELRYILDNKIEYVSFLDPSYPEKLKHCVDGPLLLFQEGNIYFDKQPVISIVGTRKMTRYGRSFLEKFITDLKKYNPIIVSGFAYGVDITAHKFAMQNELQTIAVLGNGLDTLYPKSHNKYVSKVIENGGIYTEYWHDEIPIREYFLQRNRIIAGISDATIIVESAQKGGALVTANIANSYNRDVFAVPGRITDTYSQGCNNLIRTNQAALLNTAEDLVYMLNWDQEQQAKKIIQPRLFLDLQGDEKQVYEYLQTHGKSILDSISLACKIPIYKISSVLINLELKGLVQPLPGKMFEVI